MFRTDLPLMQYVCLEEKFQMNEEPALDAASVQECTKLLRKLE